MERSKLGTKLQERQKPILPCQKTLQTLCFLPQNFLTSLPWYCMISPSLLYYLLRGYVVVFWYRSQPVFVQRSFLRTRMLRHLSDHNYQVIGEYTTAGNDQHASHIPRHAGIHGQQRKKTEKFQLLPCSVSSTVSSSCSPESPLTCTKPGRVIKILTLTKEKGRKNWVSSLRGFQSRCDPASKCSSDLWEDSIPHLPVHSGSLSRIRAGQEKPQADQPIHPKRSVSLQTPTSSHPPYIRRQQNICWREPEDRMILGSLINGF